MDKSEFEQVKAAAWHAFQEKAFRQAARQYIALIRKKPNNPHLFNMLSLCLNMMNKKKWSLKIMHMAADLAENNPAIYNNLGMLYLTNHNIPSALSAFEKARALDPNISSVSYNIAKIYFHQKRFDDAIRMADQILMRDPKNEKAIIIKGYSLIVNQHFQAGYDLLMPLFDHYKNDVSFIYHLAVAAYNLNKPQEAIDYFTFCTKKMPEKAIYWNQLAIAVKKLNKRNYLKEVKYLKKAIQLQPDCLDFYHNLANTFINANKLNIAEKLINMVLKYQPNHVDALTSQGFLLQLLGQHQQAIKAYNSAIKLDPNCVCAQTNLGLLLLAKGRFEQGWQKYEFRWQHNDLQEIKKRFTDTRWLGESLDEKTLLVFTEQGYGDTLNFVRYLPLINKGSGKIIIECRAALVDLIKTVDNIDLVVDRQSPMPEHDLYIPLISLPSIFNTSEKTIPAKVPYIKVEKNKNDYWKNYFSQFKDHINIGISWSGNRRHKLDHYRTIKPHFFTQLKMIDNINLFSLQIDDAKIHGEQYGFISLPDKIKDFTDSAAIVNNLDLIISVDTSLVHLAGALNKPVWNIVGFYADWRWLLERTDSPWYPSMRLFRQQKRDCWQDVFDEIKHELNTWLKNTGASG